MPNNAAESEWIAVAQLGKARGICGEVIGYSLSSHPERFSDLKSVRLIGDAPFATRTLAVEEVWEHGGTLIFKFAGINSMSEAETLRGAEVQIPRSERVRLAPGEYFHSDVIGCEVRDRASNRLIGTVTGFEEYSGRPMLEIDKGRTLIPFVKEFCVDIRPDDNVILTELPDGLEDLGKV